MKRIELPPHWRRRAIVITEVEQAQSWFDVEELQPLDAFRLPGRRAEWMLSRIAAKQLAIELRLCESPRSCRITDRRIGSHSVSFSHSRGYAAAAIDSAAVGIDVEKVRPLSPRAAHLFLSDSEQDAWRNCSLPNSLLHFWCAKEAAWKQLGGATLTLAKVPLQVEEVASDRILFDRVETFAAGDLVVALTRV